ncbi:ATP-binding cassette domain-containing protein [Aliirhizobium cellulosilyticum]|uniref:Alpha-D-ribose 1-methylphosphonate 5-triphosphate synthase subunit PhnL n=1 Tax=Aliirhizobium cellulosilyticum TaxID=393664 RepID=A0A7W6SDB0_9HYPH|nr:ATP-binding cassette domain-containing protein [Rhizobium cellulosilyticum]MBB4351641.1 alpha-D-ribose 1-methylphosphonate 5-triphosphate synthase subunit PhnL [Rhizobium cellulosilyticum]MBB4414893.1 alpha-D-ribose 1-methylphosphonate 5-triphosphate synthase subunit PhnL [Rhizobium cellulosilyticum]MBB4449567.1 alpha-D-ribose 1-methylphosphonate 5-triphosphate synthase subunit PhnL [Rhizobium cellulosilyticum]
MDILHVENLEKDYGARAVGPVSFRLKAGEIGLIVGGSGSGKSTVLDVLYGTRRATGGSAILSVGNTQRNLFDISVAELVSIRSVGIGYCTQFLSAIPGKSGADLANEAACADASLADITELLDRLALPQRLWNLPVSSWSGGEKQRLNIALAVLRKPALILLDEPFSALDETLHPIVWSVLSPLADEGSAMLIGVHKASSYTAGAKTLVALDRSGMSCGFSTD